MHNYFPNVQGHLYGRPDPYPRNRYRECGYSLMETMLLVGFGLIIAGITATYTLYGIRKQSQSDAMTQRELFRFRSMLLKAHMRAQRGMSTTLTLPVSELNLDFRQSPSTITFMSPDGRLQNAPSENVCFYAGKDSIWYRFRLSPAGVLEMSPVSEAPPADPPADPPAGEDPPPGNAPPPGDSPPPDGGPDEGGNQPYSPGGQIPNDQPNQKPLRTPSHPDCPLPKTPTRKRETPSPGLQSTNVQTN